MNGIVIFIALIMFLWLGRSILIPLLVATFLWYLINATATYVRKVFPYNSDRLRIARPIASRAFDWISNILSVLAMCGLIYFFATQIQPMFRELLVALPELQHRFVQFSHYLSESLGIRFDASMIPNIANIATGIGASGRAVIFLVANDWRRICGNLGIHSFHNQLYPNNWRDCGMCPADTVFTGNGAITATANINGNRSDYITDSVWQYLGTKIHGKNIKPVNTGNINKPGILGYDMGHRWYVFQCSPAGGHIHYYGAI